MKLNHQKLNTKLTRDFNIPQTTVHRELEGWSVSVLLQIPQYLVVTVAECVFATAGIDFAYSQVCSVVDLLGVFIVQLSLMKIIFPYSLCLSSIFKNILVKFQKVVFTSITHKTKT